MRCFVLTLLPALACCFAGLRAQVAGAEDAPARPAVLRLRSPCELAASPVTKPDPEALARLNKYVGRIIDPEYTLDVVEGRTRILQFKEVPVRIQIADEKVATATLVGKTPRELLLQGQSTGSCVLNVWFKDPANPDRDTVLSILVCVWPK